MNHKTPISACIALLLRTGTAWAAETAINPGTPWPATDALSRSMPDIAAVPAPRSDRFVGIFYFLWNNRDIDRLPNDLSKVLPQDPDLLNPSDVGTLASLDPALILTPPRGMEAGYVPIVTR
jgi:hypothetical protein